MLKRSTFRTQSMYEIKEKQAIKREKLLILKKSIKAPPKLKILPNKRYSMSAAIPIKMRDELQEDNFMKTCCLQSEMCKGKIEWHHNLIYAGKRINEKGAILPVCQEHHRQEATFKRKLDIIMYTRMTDEERNKYPKKIWIK